MSGSTSDGVLTYAYVDDIRQIWPVVRPGIEQIIATNHEPFIAEDVFHAIMLGHAAMYVSYRKTGEYAGFSVLAPHQFPFVREPVLNLWLGYATEPSIGHYGMEISKQVQVASGFSRMVFCTPQKGWPDRYGTALHTWYEAN